MQRDRLAQARLLVQEQSGAAKNAAADLNVQTPRAFYRYDLNKHFTIAGLPPAKSLECGQEASLKSSDSKAAVPIEFQNATTSIRKVYWLDRTPMRPSWTGWELAGLALHKNNALGDCVGSAGTRWDDLFSDAKA